MRSTLFFPKLAPKPVKTFIRFHFREKEKVYSSIVETNTRTVYFKGGNCAAVNICEETNCVLRRVGS